MSRRLAALVILTVASLTAAAPWWKGKGEALYYPTKEGDKLVYEIHWSGRPVFGMVKDELTEVVTKVEKKDDALLVTVKRETEKGLISPSQFAVSEKGVRRVATGAEELPVPIPMLKLPGKPGDTWTWEPEAIDGAPPKKWTYTLGKEEDVEVPAGKFRALRVESEIQGNNAFKSTSWYAPGVGNIKSVANTAAGEATQVLKSFTPGK